MSYAEKYQILPILLKTLQNLSIKYSKKVNNQIFMNKK